MVISSPIAAVLDVGADAIHGDRRGGKLSRLLDPGCGVETPDEKAAEIRAFWRNFVAEEGRPPTENEVVMFMVDSDYTEADLPADIAQLLDAQGDRG